MHKFLVLSTVLISSLWLNAQSSDSSAKPAKGSDKNWDVVTLDGCLDTVTGHYMLTEENGTSHELSGGARKLKSAVGHQIQITGKPGTRSVSSSQTGIASSVINYPVFEVKTLQKVGDKCTPPGK